VGKEKEHKIMSEVFKYDNQFVMDSRLVAQMIGKQHFHLMRDIKGYISVMEENPILDTPNEEDLGREYQNFNRRKIAPVDFFIPSSYINSQNKEQPCYLLTKMGCEFVANKLTGSKGILFTATYVAEFNQMEQLENQKQMIGEREDFGEIASVMKEFRLWAKAMKMPYSQAVEALAKFFHNTGVPFPDEMCYKAPIKIFPRQIAFWDKENADVLEG